MKRGNPIEEPARKRVISQSVINPIANETNVDGGNPARLKVPAGKKTVISQRVLNPASSTKDGPGKVKKR